MSHSSSVDDIEDEITLWGFSVSLSDYEKSLEAEELAKQQETTKRVGSGRGVPAVKGSSQPNNNYMAAVRLAAEIHDSKAHATPMGHLSTTTELLGSPSENEITPLLRKLGINSRDDALSSRRTRKQTVENRDIFLDANLPVIVDTELFHQEVNYADGLREETTSTQSEDEPFDPNRPLHEQFSTIKEFRQPPRETTARKNVSKSPTGNSSSTFSPATSSSSFSSTTNKTDDSPSSKKGKEKLQKGKDVLPLLSNPQHVYTPRQLYELKKGTKASKVT